MPKTRSHRARHNTTLKNKEYKYVPLHHNTDCVDATFHGLGHWKKHMFEELGWMILAKSYGMMDKVSTYKVSVKRLKCALETKIKTIKDSDKREDLKIMHYNVCILIDHIEKDF